MKLDMGLAYFAQEQGHVLRNDTCASLFGYAAISGQHVHELDLVTSNGNALVGSVRITSEDQESRFDDLLLIGDILWYIAHTWDKKTGAIDVWATGYRFQDLTVSNERLRIAHFDVAARAYDGGPLGLTFRNSPNGNKVLLYWDALRSKENEQLVLCSVFDRNWTALWSQGYRIPFDAEKIVTAALEFSNEGTVYALMRSRFKNRPITNHNVNYSFELYQMNESGMVSRPVDLPSGNAALNARISLRKDGPVVLGFMVTPDETTEKTSGVFADVFPADLSTGGDVHMSRFNTPLEYQLTRWDLLERAEGGYYIVGGSWETTAFLDERLLVAVALDASLEYEWHKALSRNQRSMINENYGFWTGVTKDHLTICFPDDLDNLQRYRTGERPKRSGRSRTVLRWDLDGDGSGSFSEANTSDNEPINWGALSNSPSCFRESSKKDPRVVAEWGHLEPQP